MNKVSEMSAEELKQKLKAARAIQITTGSIFAVIVLAWIVLGYWRTNLPVFISTVAMGLTAVAATSMTPRGLSTELAKRTEVDRATD